MKVFFSQYQLKTKKGGFLRKGALLKVCFPGGSEGFSDCHPWPKLGDAPLARQLALLKKRILTPLTYRSMVHAAVDAKARAERRSLLAKLAIPPSHYQLSLVEHVPECFSFCKVKLGYHMEEELTNIPFFFSCLPIHCQVRLDFNHRIGAKQFETYQRALIPYRQKIDFIEDPFTYHAKHWARLQTEFGVKLACDRGSDKRIFGLKSHAVSVLKPAVQNCLEIAKVDLHRIVCTSYLDHPVGQMAAVFMAAKLLSKYPGRLLHCGLLSHLLYQTNKYSEALKVKGERLLPLDKGFGIGFDQQLSEEQWAPLF